MQVLSSAKNGAQGIDINFKYEYVDGGTRNSNTSDIKISVPVSQPDRFELGDPVLPDAINAGEESTISMEYVNKAKGMYPMSKRPSRVTASPPRKPRSISAMWRPALLVPSDSLSLRMRPANMMPN